MLINRVRAVKSLENDSLDSDIPTQQQMPDIGRRFGGDQNLRLLAGAHVEETGSTQEVEHHSTVSAAPPKHNLDAFDIPATQPDVSIRSTANIATPLPRDAQKQLALTHDMLQVSTASANRELTSRTHQNAVPIPMATQNNISTHTVANSTQNLVHTSSPAMLQLSGAISSTVSTPTRSNVVMPSAFAQMQSATSGSHEGLNAQFGSFQGLLHQQIPPSASPNLVTPAPERSYGHSRIQTNAATNELLIGREYQNPPAVEKAGDNLLSSQIGAHSQHQLDAQVSAPSHDITYSPSVADSANKSSANLVFIPSLKADASDASSNARSLPTSLPPNSDSTRVHPLDVLTALPNISIEQIQHLLMNLPSSSSLCVPNSQVSTVPIHEPFKFEIQQPNGTVSQFSDNIQANINLTEASQQNLALAKMLRNVVPPALDANGRVDPSTIGSNMEGTFPSVVLSDSASVAPQIANFGGTAAQAGNVATATAVTVPQQVHVVPTHSDSAMTSLINIDTAALVANAFQISPPNNTDTQLGASSSLHHVLPSTHTMPAAPTSVHLQRVPQEATEHGAHIRPEPIDSLIKHTLITDGALGSPTESLLTPRVDLAAANVMTRADSLSNVQHVAGSIQTEQVGSIVLDRMNTLSEVSIGSPWSNENLSSYEGNEALPPVSHAQLLSSVSSSNIAIGHIPSQPLSSANLDEAIMGGSFGCSLEGDGRYTSGVISVASKIQCKKAIR